MFGMYVTAFGPIQKRRVFLSWEFGNTAGICLQATLVRTTTSYHHHSPENVFCALYSDDTLLQQQSPKNNIAAQHQQVATNRPWLYCSVVRVQVPLNPMLPVFRPLNVTLSSIQKGPEMPKILQ